ncbi:MAG: SMP-30/gluconolactonase/LRE family protein [Erythrobacter sp.]
MSFETSAKVAFGVLGVLIAYFALWPTSVDPVGWDAPTDQGYAGAFAPNDRLASMDILPIGSANGPEDIIAREEEGLWVLYASSQQGIIWRINTETKEASAFAETGGFPLGLAFGSDASLLVADAYRGLLSVSPGGQVQVLTQRVEGTPIVFADDVIEAANGNIYFTDASQRFGAEASGSPLAASIDDISEQSRTGRVLSFDPTTQKTSVLAEGLSFANGIAMSSDGAAVLVAETGTYTVHRIALNGPDKGKPVPILSNLPGFPDNITKGPIIPDGTQTYFLGLVGPRVPMLDDLSASPKLRKIISRIPDWVRPEAMPYSLVLQFTEEGKVLQTWQDPKGGFPNTTGAIAPGDGFLYVSSVDAAGIGRVPFPRSGE